MLFVLTTVLRKSRILMVQLYVWLNKAHMTKRLFARCTSRVLIVLNAVAIQALLNNLTEHSLFETPIGKIRTMM